MQDFIAAARNTRDLWSGYYLLSYLVGTALARIALDFGPDHVLFPNLANQPILDLLLKDEIWDKLKTASGEDLWQAFDYYNVAGKDRLLTPSLPNRFLALLPSDMTEHESWQEPDVQGRKGAARYAAELEQAIRDWLVEIGRSVATKCSEKLGDAFDEKRFSDQVRRRLEIHWQVLPWEKTIEDALRVTSPVPGEDGNHPLDSIRAIQAMLNRMPPEHRDPRYFREDDVGVKGKTGPLGQVANAWSALFALASWQLDAVKATRAFRAWSAGGWQVGREHNKDSLNGREEACLAVPTDEKGEKAKALSRALAENGHAFKPGDVLGASSLLKRLWHRTWLIQESGHKFVPEDFAMPNTRSIAAHQPFASNADEEDGNEDDGKYFAILALDGDEMGKWISGNKCPLLDRQVSEEARTYFQKHGNADFLQTRRPLSPSYHLQFSELLASFGLHCVRRIVQAFDGRLIYAGGDDVLAMLPADTALECARALRAAFRGEKALVELARGIVDRRSRKREDWKSDRTTPLFQVEHEGFIKLTKEAAPHGHGAEAGLLSEPVDFPFLVPGPAADCSVGIAIAHFKSPLQEVVRAAQDAEKRAKKQLGRSAVAVTLMKRSGETIEWVTQWGSHGLEIYQRMAQAMEAAEVSSRFPHRLVALLEPYLTQTTPLSAKAVEPVPDFDVASVIERELTHVIDRQGASKDAKAALRKEWLAPLADPANPNRLRRFLRWVTEQEGRAAARKLAEKLTALAGGNSEPPAAKALREVAEAPIREDSTQQQVFRTLAGKLAGRGGENEPVRIAAIHALEALDKRLPEIQLQALIGLCQTVAFAHRTAPDSNDTTPPKGNA